MQVKEIIENLKTIKVEHGAALTANEKYILNSAIEALERQEELEQANSDLCKENNDMVKILQERDDKQPLNEEAVEKVIWDNTEIERDGNMSYTAYPVKKIAKAIVSHFSTREPIGKVDLTREGGYFL